jgi:hypothetical protein
LNILPTLILPSLYTKNQQQKKTKNSSACRNQRVNGVTVLQCTACTPSYKPSSDYAACQCAPGYARASTAAACAACGAGKWCAGAEAELSPVSCGDGMTTLITTAAREDQCVTVEGHGFNGSSAAVCEVGAYSTGKTRNPCRACGSGLTTVGTQSTGFAACVAPKGYYFDKNAAKPCPRGAFSAALGRNTACTSCAAGVTTAASASDDVSKCVWAKPGYAYASQNAAVICAKGYFQSAISQTATCTQCPANMTTLKKGAMSSAACVALPGFSYDSSTNTATACAVGSFKGGYNRRGCAQCGAGFTTTGTAKISFADCYIPQGWGTVKDGSVYTASQCAAGFYGAARDTFGVKSLPCTPCPAGMTTPAAGAFAPTACVTVPGWGYDQATATAAKCPFGKFSAGGDRDECASCGEGYTTAAESSTAQTDCQIAPGWGYTAANKDPEPCAKGFYGVGGANVACAACSGTTTTTTDALATSQADCDVCVAGYGGASCGVCAANSYQHGDEAACSVCTNGAQSPAGAITADSCVPAWTPVPQSVDSVAVAVGASYVSLDAAAADAAACKAACAAADATCMFYTYDSTHGKCYLASSVAGGADSIAFKSSGPTSWYSVWSWTASLDVGEAIGAAVAAADVAACNKKCDAHDECVAAVFTAATKLCSLKAASTSPDFKTCELRAVGVRMPAVSA